MLSSSRYAESARILAYSAKAPFSVAPNSFTLLHICGMPFLQNQHSPQGICVSHATLSPGFLSVTFFPTFTITPAVSCPGIKGGFTRSWLQRSHSIICISVPHMAVQCTFISTSSSPGSGTGRSCLSTKSPFSGFSFTRPVIVFIAACP